MPERGAEPVVVRVRTIETYSVHCSACGVIHYPRTGGNAALRKADAERERDDHEEIHRDQ